MATVELVAVPTQIVPTFLVAIHWLEVTVTVLVTIRMVPVVLAHLPPQHSSVVQLQDLKIPVVLQIVAVLVVVVPVVHPLTLKMVRIVVVVGVAVTVHLLFALPPILPT